MYQSLPPGTLLSQGDIIDDCPVIAVDVSSSQAEEDAAFKKSRARVVVLTQACDLAQEKTTRCVVAPVHNASVLVDQGDLKASHVRDQIRRGLVFGWYFLPAAPTPIELPESIVDLRDLHTVSRSLLGRLIINGKRVCRIETPWREHLAQHFAVTYSRIALPEPYETQP